MKLPPFLLAAAVMFWGWQCGQWWLAALVAAGLEAPRMLKLRLVFSFADLSRIANFCTLLLLAVFVYLFVSEGMTSAIIGIIKWMPMTILPLFLAIAYGGMQEVDLSVVSFALRPRGNDGRSNSHPANLGYPYLALWALAASMMNRQGLGFYAGVLVLGAWTLWHFRPAGRSPQLWAGMFLLAALSGALVNVGLYRLQDVIEQIAMEWISGDDDEDPERARTSLGHIGQLKLSDSIALRVSSPQTLRLPLLLRTASYNTYTATTWSVAGTRGFRDLPQDAQHTAWILDDPARVLPGAQGSMEISASFTHPLSLLPLPPGAVQAGGAKFLRMNRSQMGIVQAELVPGFYSYRVAYDAGFADRTLPNDEDLKLARSDGALLRDVARSLQLEGKPPATVVKILKDYFSENFSYSTFRAGNEANRTALADFLIRDRRGHCEHFATATVLLLRAAGIPARYAVGYSVQERSRYGTGYVARRRHAHAWVSAWIDGAWQDVDTTPPSWPGLEERSASVFEPLLDAWSCLLFYLQKLPVAGYEILAYVIALLVFAWLGNKYLWRGGGLRLRRWATSEAGRGARQDRNSEPSELYRIERILAERGLVRPRHEPFMLWLARVGPQLGDEASAALRHVVKLHYRCRFGPQPVPVAEREGLKSAGRDWIARFGVPDQVTRQGN